ncbi:MAG TPA: DUF711 family protein [Levilinea sp.]|nr:DUF711 family protein [Levilinea sp.]
MKIRTITCFYDPHAHDAQVVARLGEVAQAAETRFQHAGYQVQTRRLSTTPFSSYLECNDQGMIIQTVQHMEASAAKHGFDYLAIGPASTEAPGSFSAIVPILSATRNVFASAHMTCPVNGVSLRAVRACADIIHQAASTTPDGFTNLRFAALANVRPHGPFFPASYNQAGQVGFALGIECADVAVEAFNLAGSLLEARACLTNRLEVAAAELTRIATCIAEQYAVRFYGFDFPLAPFPKDWCSLGLALERLGAPQVGLHGSLAGAAIIADTLDRGRWQRAGFNGLFFPILEDSVLARRSQVTLSVKDLLLYSAVCGAGLDTVPLPGDTPAEHIAAILVDVAALALRLDKPLTARLMPVPGKRAGEMTTFDFSFFANGRVLELDAQPLSYWMAGDESFEIAPRSVERG